MRMSGVLHGEPQCKGERSAGVDAYSCFSSAVSFQLGGLHRVDYKGDEALKGSQILDYEQSGKQFQSGINDRGAWGDRRRDGLRP